MSDTLFKGSLQKALCLYSGQIFRADDVQIYCALLSNFFPIKVHERRGLWDLWYILLKYIHVDFRGFVLWSGILHQVLFMKVFLLGNSDLQLRAS